MVRVLVTGGAGYVGSHACKELARAGHVPVAYDDLSRGHSELVKWGPLVQGDIRDPAALRAALRQHRPAAVMHFAALSYVDESVRLPLAYYDVNVRGTLTLLTAMRDEGINRIVFSSSCSVYDQGHPGPLDESAPLAPLHPYGESKAMVEQMLRDAAGAGLDSVALRYFNASGADPDGETGEWHDPETHLIPRLLAAAAGSDPEFRVNGADYATDLTDFLYRS